MTTFQTDLNHRERAKFVKQLSECAECFTKAADALGQGDDTAALVQVVSVSFVVNPLLNELGTIFASAAEAMKGANDLEKGERL